jgi:hypothetical protein
VARRDPSSRIQDAARRHAARFGSDVDVCAELQADLSDMPRAALIAEIAGRHPRLEYLNDRAYRLLVGVRDRGVVPPIEAESRDGFAREESSVAPRCTRLLRANVPLHRLYGTRGRREEIEMRYRTLGRTGIQVSPMRWEP